MKNTLLLFSVLFTFFFSVTQAQNSVLNTGKFYKLSVSESKVYKITPSFLADLGIDVNNINPKNIKIYGNGGGMLPQANAAFRYNDLEENAVFLVDGNDASFDSEDYLLFYGEAAHKVFFDSDNQKMVHETHLYADDNYYFLTISETESKQLTVSENLTETPNASYAYFDDFIYHESEDFNLLESGRMWFGERFVTNSVDFVFDVSNIVNGLDINFEFSVMSVAKQKRAFDIKVNNIGLGEIEVAATPNFTYGFKARVANKIFTLQNNGVLTNAIDLEISFPEGNASANDIGYLDFFRITVPRELKLYKGFTIFRNLESRNNAVSEFTVSDLESNSQIWNISTPVNPKKQDFTFSGTQGNFRTNTNLFVNDVETFIVFNPILATVPTFVTEIESQNLHGATAPNLLIVTSDAFKPEAERLAEFKRSNDNLSVLVATTSQIYNEFSSGKQDVSAIRDFAKMLYEKDQQFRYLLLFGDASYDYKNNSNNVVPVYESRQSLHNIASFSSDDYYGFLDDDEGYWEESNINDSFLENDIGIGRLPIKDITEAKEVVDKTIYYASNTKTFGKWRNKVVLLADDGNNNIHANQANDLASQIELNPNYKKYNTNRLFIDAYPQESTANGKTSPIVKEKIVQIVEQGALIINYTGHGSETQLTKEAVLTSNQISKWTNLNNLPIMITATCEFGRYDGSVLSGAERAVLNPNGGAIALLTTTRSVRSSTNFRINESFYNNSFPENDTEILRLGDVIKNTKNQALVGISNRNFTLLGDPSLALAYPKESIIITKINNINFNNSTTPTLKALEEITMQGEIQKGGQLSSNFNGELLVTIFEKRNEFTTLGDKGGIDEDNSITTYKTRENKIFEGKAIVQNGVFSFSFIVPKDIDYTLGEGKISLYAADLSRLIDAGGGTTNIIIGGSSEGNEDIIAPEITAFMNDESFVSGQKIPSNSTLFIELEDESGINILGTRLGHQLTAVLDDDIENPIILNDFYTPAELNNFTKGNITFPLSNISDGKHSIEITAWDNYNNSKKKTIKFEVGDRNTLLISDLMVYPNPSSRNQAVKFKFSHNKEGESLEIQVVIYNSTGQLISRLKTVVFDTTSEVDELQWNKESAFLRQGLYLYEITVITTESGISGKARGKFVINE